MTRPEYAEKCVELVTVMRECAAEDPALAEFLGVVGLLSEPVFEEGA